MGLHNPLPSSLASECNKCGQILTSFINPRQAFGPDKVIPPSVLMKAKGLAILTVIKAGFLGSARFGSGLVVARLPDGTWSAPSAIATGGAGFGGQIGLELTDFVFILNDASAVKTFSQAGSLTLGGNVSIAAGPVGRNAEAAGAASLKSVAGIFSYSRTKGLFAGVSLEGSAIIERKDANEKLYGHRYTAAELLGGNVPPPAAANSLLNVLNQRAFNGMGQTDSMYNDQGGWDGSRGEDSWRNRNADDGRSHDEFGRPKRATTWQDDVYDQQPTSFGRDSRSNTFNNDNYGQTSPTKAAAPGRPAAPKPNFASKQALMKKNEAVALFSFEAERPEDLSFKKGDIITVLKRTENETDWWTGMIGTRHGIFPSNYVRMKEDGA